MSYKFGCIVGEQVINNISYTGHLVMLCPGKVLQKLMDICESYGAAHDIAYNQKKTACIILPKYKLLNSPKILLNGAPLTFVTCYRYLGIICLNSLMEDNDNMTRQIRCINIYMCILFQRPPLSHTHTYMYISVCTHTHIYIVSLNGSY